MITIEIEVAEDGTITVGAMPPMEESAEGAETDEKPYMQHDKSYMQPAESIDDALAMAKALIDQGAKQPGKTKGAGIPDIDSEDSFSQGFQGVRGKTSIGS